MRRFVKICTLTPIFLSASPSAASCRVNPSVTRRMDVVIFMVCFVLELFLVRPGEEIDQDFVSDGIFAEVFHESEA